jgi:hypothetical protein
MSTALRPSLAERVNNLSPDEFRKGLRAMEEVARKGCRNIPRLPEEMPNYQESTEDAPLSNGP